MAKDFSIINKRIKEILEKLQSKEIQTPIAKMAVDVLYKRVKSGYGVTSDDVPAPDKRKLTPLSKNYEEVRKGKAKWFTSKTGHIVKINGNFTKPALGEFGSPGKSNLTMSGEMLSALTYKLMNNGFMLYIKGKFNQDKAKWNSEGRTSPNRIPARPFMAITESEQKVLRREYVNALRKIIRSLGLTRRG
jgi:phage gpG-like protein